MSIPGIIGTVGRGFWKIQGGEDLISGTGIQTYYNI